MSKPSTFSYESDNDMVDKDMDFDIEKLINDRDMHSTSSSLKKLQAQIEFLKNEINESRKTAVEDGNTADSSEVGIINVKNIESIANCLKSVDLKTYVLIFLINLVVYSSHIDQLLMNKLGDTRYVRYMFLIKALLSVFFMIIISKIC